MTGLTAQELVRTQARFGHFGLSIGNIASLSHGRLAKVCKRIGIVSFLSTIYGMMAQV